MKEIDTIRAYIELGGSHTGPCTNEAEGSEGACFLHLDMSEKRREAALAALSTIDSDAKPQDPGEDARGFAMKIFNWTDPLPYYESEIKHVDRAAALITAHDDAIRLECADRAVASFRAVFDDMEERREAYVIKSLRAAIMGTEPAQERKPE